MLNIEEIRKDPDNQNWYSICTNEVLSEDFIREFQDKVNWYYISTCQKLSEEFRKEFNLDTSKHSWMYWEINQKREYIQTNHPEYKIIDNKIIAYKSTRFDGYSVFNFYEVEKEYSAHANCNSNSFGLSDRSKGKLFKVEIDLEDLVCITKEGKIQASKIKILEEISF